MLARERIIGVEFDLRPALTMLKEGRGLTTRAKALGMARSTQRRRLMDAGKWTPGLPLVAAYPSLCGLPSNGSMCDHQEHLHATTPNMGFVGRTEMVPRNLLALLLPCLLLQAGCDKRCDGKAAFKKYRQGFLDCKDDLEYDSENFGGVACYADGWSEAGC